MPVLWKGPMGSGAKKLPPLFTYTGNYAYDEYTDPDGTVHWELALLTSGTLTFSRVVPKVDLFLVGGGEQGNAGSASGSSDYIHVYGGDGGDGGKTLTQTGVPVAKNTAYSVVVGDGESGDDPATASTALGYSSANGNAGATGADGAYCQYYNSANGHDAGNGDPGVYAFGDAACLLNPGRKYGAAGAGGAARFVNSQNAAYNKSAGTGGDTGGGDGGTPNAIHGSAGAANTGSGGGGGWSRNYDVYAGAPGGSGIAILRDAR